MLRLSWEVVTSGGYWKIKGGHAGDLLLWAVFRSNTHVSRIHWITCLRLVLQNSGHKRTVKTCLPAIIFSKVISNARDDER
jgi:hypothetical protein